MEIRRRRECLNYGKRSSTIECFQLMIVKRDGIPEELNREKVVQSARRVCQRREVSESQLRKLTQKAGGSLHEKGTPRVDSNGIGLTILEPSEEPDEVGYLRFASMYKFFPSVDDFAQEIADMRKGKEPQVNGNGAKKN